MIPVAVLAAPDAFVIGLPWGAQTNWVQNVLAANGCTIRWKGIYYTTTDPQLVDKAAALAAANGLQRAAIKRGSFPAFLQLKR